jgi:tryptophan synthase beta chain
MSLDVPVERLDAAALLTALIHDELPDARGRYGPFGGRFVPETLMPALARLEQGAAAAFADRAFLSALEHELRDWVGRPTPLTHARELSRRWGAQAWLKREDLAHTGAHKINNAIGQALLARRLGAARVVAETGAGQHGVAAAAACARVGLPCRVYMGSVDVARQSPNVDRMRRLGAEVVPVTAGDATLRAAIDEALRDWVAHPEDTYYMLGSAVGPHPYPWLVQRLQSVIGREARAQLLDRCGMLPDAALACVGGGSNAIGLFHPLLGDAAVRLIGIEAGGRGARSGEHSATIAHGRPGVLHGSHSLLLQDEDGQVIETHSIAPGLDYPGVGPEHALLRAIGRVEYQVASDDEALAALDECCAAEGILPALESAHALAGARRFATEHPDALLLIGLSGRGDKDLPALDALRGHARADRGSDGDAAPATGTLVGGAAPGGHSPGAPAEAGR